MSGLIWIQTVLHSDGIVIYFDETVDFEIKSADDKKALGKEFRVNFKFRNFCEEKNVQK